LKRVIEQHQIRCVVNLCEPGEMGETRIAEERQAVASSGARLIQLTMPTSISPSDEAIQQHLALLSTPTTIQCWCTVSTA
jgi:hypothetical protein